MTALPATLYSREPMALHRHGLHMSTCERVASLHVVSPSNSPLQRPDNGLESDMGSYPLTGRISQEHPIDQIDEREFKDLVSACILADHGNAKSVMKQVAQAADASPETAKTWINGVSAPGFYRGLKLAAKTPSLAKEVVRLIAMDADLHPEMQRDMAEFMRKWGGR